MRNIWQYFQMNRTKWGCCHFNHFQTVLLDSEKKTAAKKLSLKTPSASSLEKCGKPTRKPGDCRWLGVLSLLVGRLETTMSGPKILYECNATLYEASRESHQWNGCFDSPFLQVPGQFFQLLVRHSNIAPFTHHLLDQWMSYWNIFQKNMIEYVSIFQFGRLPLPPTKITQMIQIILKSFVHILPSTNRFTLPYPPDNSNSNRNSNSNSHSNNNNNNNHNHNHNHNHKKKEGLQHFPSPLPNLPVTCKPE